jgi:O-antigen/teichoic acid export membrane protein
VFFKKDVINNIKTETLRQEATTKSAKELFLELFNFSIPFLIGAILASSMEIFNTTFFQRIMDIRGESAEEIKTLYTLLNLDAKKLTSVPLVLAPGFSAAIIPFITISYENKDWQQMNKNILSALESVLFIGVPLCFILFGLSTEIYYVMYGAGDGIIPNYILGGEVLKWVTLAGFFGMITPVVGSLMMATRLRKISMFTLLLGCILKGILIFPFIYYFGYSGTVTSTVVVATMIISLNFYFLKKEYGVKFFSTFRKFIGMIIASSMMLIIFLLIQKLGFIVVESNRFIALLKLGVFGIIGMIIYLIVTFWLRIPQSIFGIKLEKIFKRKKK